MSHYHPKSREYTNKILEAVAEGMLDKDMVIMSCLKYMSEDQVKDMAEANCFFEYEEGEEEEENIDIDLDGGVSAVNEQEEEEEEWTPDNADFNDKGSRHHY
jgi:hypothetical protein